MKYLIQTVLFLLILMIAACSPKTAEVVEEDTTENTTPPTKQEPENPCTTFANLTTGERDEVETAYVLYKDLVKAQKYEEAKPYWEKAFYGAPAADGRVKYQFNDGIAIYTHLYNNADNDAMKSQYVDSVMAIYDKRMMCYGQEAYTMGRKGFDYYYNFPGTVSDAEIYDMFKKNIDVKGEKADYFIINPFTKILSDRVMNEEISNEEGRKYAKMIMDAIEYGKANCKGTLCESWEIIDEYAPVRLETFEGIDGFYGCDYYADKYFSRFQESPTDCDVINLVGRRLKRGDCPENDPRLVEVTEAYKANCREQNTQGGCVGQGYTMYNNGQYKDAVAKFNECLADVTDPGAKAKLNILIAKIYYRDIKNFPQSRKYALAAAEHKANWGEPYLLIGKLYASSGPLCGSGRGWNSQVVTWPAIDKFKYAKSIDSDAAAEANKWINTYSQYMPKKEDIFQRRIKAGSTYKVPCWIQESTIVRTAD